MSHEEVLATQVGAFDAPRRTITGAAVIRTLGVVIADDYPEATSVLIVSDGFIARSNLLAGLLESLSSAGLRASVFSDIDAEPTEEAVNRALEVIEPNAVVVGIGGGSAMDTAKLVALVAGGRNAGASTTVRDIIGATKNGQSAAPLILVPTTTGTGAEVTRVAMVTIDDAKQAVVGRQLIPDLVVLDPDLVADLPGPIVASTGMDAIAHAVEAALATSRSLLSVQASFTALEVMLEAVPAATADSSDRLARARAQWGAYVGGLALNAGVVLGHSIAYGIAHHAGLPHGTTTAMALPYCLIYNDPQGYESTEADRLIAARLARTITGGASESLFDAAVAIRELTVRLGLPGSLGDVGLTAAQARDVADRCIELHPRATNPRPFEQESLRALLTAAHRGDLEAASHINARSGARS